MEWTESGRTAAGIAFEFQAGEEGKPSSPSSSPSRGVPRRIRRRLAEARGSPPFTSQEDIDARLREADLRRQQFHAWLSSKARQKPRSPSWSSQEEDPGQRLEAKLYAAEQKRLSLLAKAQMRLARLDELRQAARTSVELRLEKEREKLGTKVESRVQQAEEKRMLLLKASMQRRHAAQERKARSLLQRKSREAKYKERVRMAISQKRAAAEKKRLGMLEAEKSRACARVMQARRIAKFVCSQRESERRKLKEQLDGRIQRARWQRAEYLKQRGASHSPSKTNSLKHLRQGEILSRKLARCWRQYATSKRTTLSLAKEFQALDVCENSVRTMKFEQIASRIQSATNLQIVKSLLDRLESRLMLLHRTILLQPENIDHLLKRAATPNKRASSGKASNARGKMRKDQESKHHETRKLSRYPVRVVLCAYMILGHPDAVFNGQGNCEKELADSAVKFIKKFELLIKIILDGPLETMLDGESQSPSRHTFRSELAAFDSAWRSYLYRFVIWKVKDAKLLEEDLVRAACQLELSMMQTCKLTSDGGGSDLTHDMKAIQKQVAEDQQLLRERVRHLSGNAGIERMKNALSDARSKFFEAKEYGNSPMMPVAHISSPLLVSSTQNSSGSSSERFSSKSERRPNSVVRPLFVDNGHNQSIPEINVPEVSLLENEQILNELLHDPHGSFINSLGSSYNHEKTLKAEVKRTMEKAFWDGILDSLTKDSPDFEQIVMLVKEVRDELCGMAPEALKLEIKECIDIDMLSEQFHSGLLDLDYLGKILEYSLGILQKLSAPAKEAEMKTSHLKMLQELADIAHSDGRTHSSFVTAIVKGIRFVLEETKALRKEISKAHIQMMLPFIRSPAGLEYLRKAFEDHHGPPCDAVSNLPLTKQWLVSLERSFLEWKDHTELLSTSGTHQNIPVATPLRSGGKALLGPASSEALSSANSDIEECKGEWLDVLLRIGLLKLATNVEGLTEVAVPETLKLNLLRLRAVQGNLQKIIVISTSMLVLRQILISEKIATKSVDIEDKVSGCVKNLCGLLEHLPDVGIVEIIDCIISSCMEERLGETKEILARVIVKSLQAGDVVFEKVRTAVYLATRFLVLGGCGVHVRRLAELALGRIGASMLLDQVVSNAVTLFTVAKISGEVHASWYRFLLQT